MHICCCANEPLRETQMGLSPIENRLSVGGSKSELLMKGMSVSSILSESHDNVLAFLPPLSKWEQWPVLFRISPTGTSNISRQDCTDPFSPIRINGNGVTVPFETPLFRGHVIIRMAGLPNAEDYFHGRKRLTDFVVQGQFRRPVSFNRLMTGQKFVNKLKSVHRGLAKVMAGFIKRIQPSVEIDLLSENPFWVSATFLFCLPFLKKIFLLTCTPSLSLFLCFPCALYISPNGQCTTN